MNRNCNEGFYPMYPGMPMPTFPINNNENEKLNAQIQNLERRVSRLENMLNNNYPDSNYHIM